LCDKGEIIVFASAQDVAEHVMNNLCQTAPHAPLIRWCLGPANTPLCNLSVGGASVRGVCENAICGDWANRYLRWG